MRHQIISIAVAGFYVLSSSFTLAQGPEGVLARCGASKGTGYYFFEKVMNPDGPRWEDDGISNGKILLVRLGDEWDIQFDDAIGSNGYRQQGAQVDVLGAADLKLTVGAFNKDYTEIYTFNFAEHEVVWTTHKIGTFMPKVAIYKSDCEFMAEY